MGIGIYIILFPLLILLLNINWQVGKILTKLEKNDSQCSCSSNNKKKDAETKTS